MQNSHSSKGAVKFSVWWLFLVNGILILPVILLAAITAQGRYVYLAPYLSVIFGIAAVLNIIATVLNRRKIPGWGLTLAPSIALFLLSVFIAFIGLATSINELVFAFYVGFAFFFASFFTVSISFAMKNLAIKLWPLTFSFSVLTMLLGMGLFLYPLHEALMLQTWTAFAFISLFLTYFVTAFLLLSANRKNSLFYITKTYDDFIDTPAKKC